MRSKISKPLQTWHAKCTNLSFSFDKFGISHQRRSWSPRITQPAACLSVHTEWRHHRGYRPNLPNIQHAAFPAVFTSQSSGSFCVFAVNKICYSLREKQPALFTMTPLSTSRGAICCWLLLWYHLLHRSCFWQKIWCCWEQPENEQAWPSCSWFLIRV